MTLPRKLSNKVLLFFALFGSAIFFIQEGLISNAGGEKGDSLTCKIEAEQLKDDQLLSLVALPGKKLDIDVAKMIYGAEKLGHYKFAVSTETDETKNDPSHFFQATDCPDLALDNPKYLYCLLKALYYSPNTEYRWFLVASEIVYPLMKNITHNLLGLNSDTFLYMGEQLQDHSSNQWYCSLKSGLLLSRKALQTIVEEVESCLLSGTNGAGDVVLGRCIATTVHESCLKKNKVSECLVLSCPLFGGFTGNIGCQILGPQPPSSYDHDMPSI